MNRVRAAAVAALAAVAMLGTSSAAWASPAVAGPLDSVIDSGRDGAGAASLTVATVEADLSRGAEGDLAADLASRDDAQAIELTEAVQRQRPDVLVLTGVDVDTAGDVAASLRDDYFAVSRADSAGIRYDYTFAAPTNVGQPSGTDLDGDNVVGGAGDAYGEGDFAGQRSMLVFSTRPIDAANVRSFNSMLWKDLPGNQLRASGLGSVAAASIPLQSTSVWDLPVRVGPQTVHVVATSTTSGSSPADALRRADQQRFLRDYVAGSASLSSVADDKGREGPLPAGSRAVVVGSLGQEAADRLLKGSSLVDPASEPLPGLGSSWWGAAMARLQGGVETSRIDAQGDATRADYVLPSTALTSVSSGSEDAVHRAGASNRLVWLRVTA